MASGGLGDYKGLEDGLRGVGDWSVFTVKNLIHSYF